MPREVLGEGIGTGYAHVGVSLVLDAAGKSMLGKGAAFLDVKQYSVNSDKMVQAAVCLSGTDIDKLIPLLREAKRRLLEVGAS